MNFAVLTLFSLCAHCDIAQHFHGWLVAKTRMSYVPHFLPKNLKELVDPDQAPPLLRRAVCAHTRGVQRQARRKHLMR